MGDIRTSRREDCARAVYSHLHMDELKRQAASFFLTFTLNYNYRLTGGCLHTKGPCGLRSAPALVASHEAAMWSQSQNVGTRASRSPCLAHGLCGRGSLLSHPGLDSRHPHRYRDAGCPVTTRGLPVPPLLGVPDPPSSGAPGSSSSVLHLYNFAILRTLDK